VAPDGRGGILRVTQDGQIVNGEGILGDERPLDLYYAYGIRNSFGMAFDPLIGNLWDTKNGGSYDETNLVEPGFNS
jgi:glucose/arabinose dehydrogenase